MATGFKLLLIGLGVAWLFTSCSVFIPRSVKKHFTICYTGQSTGLDTLINLHGTYETSNVWWNTSGYGKTYDPRWDTSRLDMILLPDGVALSMLCSSVRREALNSGTDSAVTPEPCAYMQGVYQVVNDTIRLQLFTDNRWGWAGWWTEEKWFKITSRNTLEYLGYYDPRIGLTKYEPEGLNQRIYTFHPTRTLPASKDIWLTKKKWFTCRSKD